MSKEGNSKREDQIEALHAAAIAQHGGGRGCTWWVFTSRTADGAWLFTYRPLPAGDVPGAGWKEVPARRIASVTVRGEGEEGYVRVNP